MGYRKDPVDIQTNLDRQTYRVDCLFEKIDEMESHTIGIDWFVSVKRSLFILIIAVIVLFILQLGMIESYGKQLKSIDDNLECINYKMRK